MPTCKRDASAIDLARGHWFLKLKKWSGGGGGACNTVLVEMVVGSLVLDLEKSLNTLIDKKHFFRTQMTLNPKLWTR